MMYGREKSDPAIVTRKSANAAALAAAEQMEPRAGAEENASQQSTCRAQNRASVSQALERVRPVAQAKGKERFTALLHQPDPMPQTWPRHWGAQLWAINFLYLPGYRDPLVHRWPNWCGIGIRIFFALFFFSQGDGFIPMGIWDGISGLLLLFTYLPVARSAPAVSSLR